MQLVVNSCIQANVLSKTGFFRLVLRLRATATVGASLNANCNFVKNRLYDWHYNTKYHSADKCIANYFEPSAVKVAQTATNQSKS